eukprot:CAMPEP_0198108242 /NCGR_PEP_ID=MMETSP1442-20131203/302_1 /TAXON_ID= /ORGANISM="Craspedostauros australis, Strain CCMP3328" /LENGTH=186 /DNA_ID=CAMNT_0043763471 /DNA_START=99 /DNA_END=659 /DNA_ORIENTATION=+
MILDKMLGLCCSQSETMSTALKMFGKKKDDKIQEEEEVAAPAKRDDIIKVSAFTGVQTKYENMKWKQLSIKARKAAKVLGYEEESWNDSTWIEVSDYHWWDLSEEQKAAAETMGWSEGAWESQYEDYSWEDLPEIVKKAATAGGFTSAMWDEDTWPEDLYKSWDELTNKQRDAMAVLGYGRETWDH